VVAAVTGLPPERITISEGGAVAWSDVPGTPFTAPFEPAVKITLVVPPGWDPAALAASARTAAEPALPVFSQPRIEVVES
jgi:hypothetical protein